MSPVVALSGHRSFGECPLCPGSGHSSIEFYRTLMPTSSLSLGSTSRCVRLGLTCDEARHHFAVGLVAFLLFLLNCGGTELGTGLRDGQWPTISQRAKSK